MKLSMCHCENNSASLFGGGIYVVSTAIFSADSSRFAENQAGQGGAINIEVCLFENLIPAIFLSATESVNFERPDNEGAFE